MAHAMSHIMQAKNLIAGQFFIGPPLINRAGVCQRLIQRALTTSRDKTAAKVCDGTIRVKGVDKCGGYFWARHGGSFAKFSPRAAMATRLSFPAARQFVRMLASAQDAWQEE